MRDLAPTALHPLLRMIVAACLFGVVARPSWALADDASPTSPPLHQRIDALLPAAHVAALADDAEFLRRVCLDLVGEIPSAAEARTFLIDPSPEKRTALVDRLLADERFDRNMAERLTVMLMERRLPADKPEIEKFEAYLRRSIAANKPLDRLAAELLNPDPDDEASRDAAIFWTKRLENYGQNPVDLPGLTRDVGRLFLGVDLKCAQCHNHLTVKEWKQADYQGLFAFVGHTYIRKDVPHPAVGEKLVDKKVEFASVFSGDKKEVGPKLMDLPEVEIPAYAKGAEWIDPPDRKRNFQGIPKFSPLKVLAEQLPRADNERFTQNLANRLWFLMTGRGVVHPLDLNHKENPPTVPDLLETLSAELVKTKFDLRSFVRQVALSRAYQRSSRIEGDAKDMPGQFTVAQLRRLSAEQLLRSMLVATGERDAVMKRSAGLVPKVVAKKNDDGEEEDDEPAKPQAASAEPTFVELRKKFVAAFAAPPGEPETEFNPTVASALFVLNDPAVVAWGNRRDGNLIDRLAKIDDAGKLADELYLSVLTRFPTDDERTEVREHLSRVTTTKREPRGSAPGPDGAAHARDGAIGELVWALLASTEFAVNH